MIDEHIHQFFQLFENRNEKIPALEKLRELCLPQVMIMHKEGNSISIMTLEEFITPRHQKLTDGSLSNFQEHEIKEITHIENEIAQRISRYQKIGILNGVPFQGEGTKSFQLIKQNKKWRIASIIWEDSIG